MNITRHARRLAAIVAIAASALLALVTAAPVMAATASVPHYGQPVAPLAPVQVVTASTVSSLPEHWWLHACQRGVGDRLAAWWRLAWMRAGAGREAETDIAGRASRERGEQVGQPGT